MHGLTLSGTEFREVSGIKDSAGLQASRTVLPRWLNSQPSLTPAVCGEKGPIDRAVRAEKHTVGHNSVATFDVPRESVLENRGNAQPEYPLRGILAL
jgi:hypothetical protein